MGVLTHSPGTPCLLSHVTHFLPRPSSPLATWASHSVCACGSGLQTQGGKEMGFGASEWDLGKGRRKAHHPTCGPSPATYGRGDPTRSHSARRWSWVSDGRIRVPKPSSTFSNQGGLDSRSCSTRGTRRPSVRQLGGAKARGLGGARVGVGRGKHSPTPYFCLLVGIQRAMATTSPRGASGYSYSCS